MEALFLELGRIGEISRRMCGRALSRSKQDSRAQHKDRRALNSLVDAVGEFAVRMRQNRMSEDVSILLPNALRVSRYYSEAAELAENVAGARISGFRIERPELMKDIMAFEARVDQMVRNADPRLAEYSPEVYQRLLQQILEEYQTLKSNLLKAGAEGLVPVRSLVDELDMLSNIRRIGEQIEKGSRYLAELVGHPYAPEK
jgi:phosphate:Na+ symporter